MCDVNGVVRCDVSDVSDVCDVRCERCVMSDVSDVRCERCVMSDVSDVSDVVVLKLRNSEVAQLNFFDKSRIHVLLTSPEQVSKSRP